jgi:hypothetical protein
MSRDFDYRAEAEVAMREAAAATTAVERIKWVRLALAWQDLARSGEGQDGVARWVTKRLITERHLREAHRLGWRCLREPAQHGSVPEQ